MMNVLAFSKSYAKAFSQLPLSPSDRNACVLVPEAKTKSSAKRYWSPRTCHHGSDLNLVIFSSPRSLYLWRE